MFDGWTEQEKEILSIVGILLGFGAGGAFSIVVLGAAIERWFISVGVFIQGTDVPFVFPWTTDVGFDTPRLLIAIGAVLVLVMVLVALIIRARRAENIGRG